jgi:hypothetical protein
LGDLNRKQAERHDRRIAELFLATNEPQIRHRLLRCAALRRKNGF